MALVEGVRYGLHGQNASGTHPQPPDPHHHHGPTKSVVFVKLTDSALKAIEDYLRTQHKTGQQQPATLQFLGNEGQIHIPSTQTYNGKHSFDFSLSSEADIEGPQGSFECIQRCGPSSLESMGTVPFKLRIHAKDDVFDTTKQKMNALEETKKHDCAKEIKLNGADIGRKVKKKVPRGTIPPPVSQRRREPSPVYSNQNKPSPHFNNQINRLSHEFQSLNQNNNQLNNITANNHPPGHHPTTNNQPSNFIKSNLRGHGAPKPYSGSDITRRPLRDRLIHLLALKSYKKPEILTKLNRDGMKDKDRKLLMPLLSQVAALKNNEYILNRGIWNDIQEDWPFYTEQEKQVMKRRKPQNLTPPGSDCSTGSFTSLSSLSPRSTTSSGSGLSPPSSYSNLQGLKSNNTPNGIMMNGIYMEGSLCGGEKRPAEEMETEGMDDIAGNKRQRISHIKRDTKRSKEREGPANTEHSSSLSKYTSIRTPEQKSRYKAEFNADYKEYRKLHSVIDQVSKHFAHLEERLLQAEHGSQDYENVKQLIVNEYNSKKSSSEYLEAKEKFSYLHDKLSHIKRLVVEYNNLHSKRRRSSASASADEYDSH